MYFIRRNELITYLGILQWVFFCRIKFAELETQEGPPCLWHCITLPVLLVLSALRFCMWLKHPLPKGTCPDFEVPEDSVTVCGMVPLCGKQFQCFTAGVISSLPQTFHCDSSFQLLNERSCMFLELETCSHVAVGLMLLFFCWTKQTKKMVLNPNTPQVLDKTREKLIPCSVFSCL